MDGMKELSNDSRRSKELRRIAYELLEIYKVNRRECKLVLRDLDFFFSEASRESWSAVTEASKKLEDFNREILGCERLMDFVQSYENRMKRKENELWCDHKIPGSILESVPKFRHFCRIYLEMETMAEHALVHIDRTRGWEMEV